MNKKTIIGLSLIIIGAIVVIYFSVRKQKSSTTASNYYPGSWRQGIMTAEPTTIYNPAATQGKG